MRDRACRVVTEKQLGGPAVQTLKANCPGGTWFGKMDASKLRGNEGCGKWETQRVRGDVSF